MSHRQIKPFTVEVRRSRLRPTILGFAQTGGRDLFGDGLPVRDTSPDMAYDAAMRAASRAFETYEDDLSSEPTLVEDEETEAKSPRILRNETKEEAYTPQGLVRSMKEALIAERTRKRQATIESNQIKAKTPVETPEEPAPEQNAPIQPPAPVSAKTTPKKHPEKPRKALVNVARPETPKTVETAVEPSVPRLTARRRLSNSPPVLLAGERWKRRLRWVK